MWGAAATAATTNSLSSCRSPMAVYAQKNISYDYDQHHDNHPNEISGSAVLLALQKATAQKSFNNNHNNKKKKKNKTKNTQVGSEEYTPHVKPLRIKTDWKARLDELEKQLRHLIHT